MNLNMQPADVGFVKAKFTIANRYAEELTKKTTKLTAISLIVSTTGLILFIGYIFEQWLVSKNR